MEIKKYVIILVESLEKKKRILQALLEECRKQEAMMRSRSEIDAFEESVSYKGKLIEGIDVLDKGFEQLYQQIGKELASQTEQYRNEIKKMQVLISDIAKLSVLVQTAEQKNKEQAEAYFSFSRGRIRQAKKSVRAASEYYKSMNGLGHYGNVSVLDKKK